MSIEMLLVLIILIITIVLFIIEKIRTDVIAIFIMVTLALLGLISPSDTFSGFASNAVIAVMGVMILGYGMSRSGAMDRLIQPILKMSGTSEKRLTVLISSSVAFVGAFIQNIGTAALFLPVVMRISKKSRMSPSRLVLPLGYITILSGTLTLIASGPLIVLNDLLQQGGNPPFGIFDVTPIGIGLVTVGIIYFIVFGKYVLPRENREIKSGPQEEIITTWKLPSTLYQCVIQKNSQLIGKTREEVKLFANYNLHLLLIEEDEEVLHAPWRHYQFSADQKLLLLGKLADVQRFSKDYALKIQEGMSTLEDFRTIEGSGFTEVIIPYKSKFIGKSIREIAMRKTYAVEPLILLQSETVKYGEFSDEMLHSGDTIIIFGPWKNIKRLADNRNVILATTLGMETTGKTKPIIASLCMMGAIILALMGLPLSLAFISGALVMILTKVISIDDAYRAIDWRTIFLLAGLIPLGIAMEKTGTASFLIDLIIHPLQLSHPLVIMTVIALIATIFTLFMSNVATTILLVPLAMTIATGIGFDPRAFALLVAISASNSFALPTHQVNAFLLSAGGYKNADYLKAGIPLSLLFIGVAVMVIYLLFI